MTSFLALLSRFGIIGVAATLTYLVVANVLIAAGIVAVYASVLAYLAGMVVSFLGQSKFTFRVGKAERHHFVRFVILSTIGLAVSYGAVRGASTIGLPAFVGTLATAILIPLLSFVVMKLWVFRERTAP